MNAARLQLGIFILASLLTVQTYAADTAPSELTELHFDDLARMPVTSVSKKEQPAFDVAAALFVITQDDIARSGATNIPDLLRMVPGLDVGQINGSTWAVSSRGFNGQFSNKLLVMIDRRIVYTPNFAGVYWDTVDLPLENIDRIEVIRGPGGTIWGANAVNGVISIFTKRAANTQGVLATAESGSLLKSSATLQYGGKWGTDGSYRVYGKYTDQGEMRHLDGGAQGGDPWHQVRTGVRLDRDLSSRDSVSLQGDFYLGRESELAFMLPDLTAPGFDVIEQRIDLAGGTVQGTWNHTFTGNSDTSTQLSFNAYHRGDPLEAETRHTLDLDFQHHLAIGVRHDVVWGVGYHYTEDDIGESITVRFVPPRRSLQVLNAFAQDEIALVPKRWYAMVGSKIEHNDFTGLEVIPSVRLAFHPNERQMAWGAVSRALRAPSRNDANLVVNLGGFVDQSGLVNVISFRGDANARDETLTAYELGYRVSFSDRFSLDGTAYFNDYGRLQSIESEIPFLETTPAPAHLVLPIGYQYLMSGQAYGFELAANWKATDRWLLAAGLASERLHLHPDAASNDVTTAPYTQGGAPRESMQLRSHLAVSHALAWDLSLYYVDALHHQSLTFDALIPAYARLDTGVTWRSSAGFTASLVGQNLLDHRHVEFLDFFGSMQSGRVPRSVYAKLAWRF